MDPRRASRSSPRPVVSGREGRDVKEATSRYNLAHQRAIGRILLKIIPDRASLVRCYGQPDFDALAPVFVEWLKAPERCGRRLLDARRGEAPRAGVGAGARGHRRVLRGAAQGHAARALAGEADKLGLCMTPGILRRTDRRTATTHDSSRSRSRSIICSISDSPSVFL